jgi:hypothetical protein
MNFFFQHMSKAGLSLHPLVSRFAARAHRLPFWRRMSLMRARDFRPLGVVGGLAAFVMAASVLAAGPLPEAKRRVYVVKEDKELSGETAQLVGRPSDGGAPENLRYSLGSILPTSGKIEIEDETTGRFVYTPTPNFYGVDSFSFKVTEGELVSFETVNSINVNSEEDPPEAYPFRAVIPLGRPFVGQLQAFDVDHEDSNESKLVFALESGPAGLLI